MAYYRFKYLTSEKYDNIYINQYFREIDQRRAKSGKETVLPLTKKEKLTYVPVTPSINPFNLNPLISAGYVVPIEQEGVLGVYFKLKRIKK